MTLVILFLFIWMEFIVSHLCICIYGPAIFGYHLFLPSLRTSILCGATFRFFIYVMPSLDFYGPSSGQFQLGLMDGHKSKKREARVGAATAQKDNTRHAMF
jgi:hypothetical protein